jgi:hypothetical protein
MENTLDLLLDAVATMYSGDSTRPGVLMSKLRNGECYASILRFPEGSKGQRSVIARARGANQEVALKNLAKSWLNSPKEQNPIEKLRNHVTDKDMEETSAEYVCRLNSEDYPRFPYSSEDM